MKELDGIKYPRTIIDVRTLLQDPDIEVDPCSRCKNCMPENMVPCSLHTSGMSEVGIGVMCMDNKVQITGRRREEIPLQLPESDGIEIVLLESTPDSEIEA